MAQAQVVTFRLIVDQPQGLLISDTFYAVNGGRKPIVLRNAGDVVDVALVDAKTFAYSQLFGQLHHHVFLSKRMTTAISNVDDDVAKGITAALANLQKPVLGATPTQIVEVEPGLQIAVAAVPEPPHLTVVETEPPVVTDGVVIKPVTGDVEAPDTTPVTVVDTVDDTPGWKDNLDYATQKAKIVQSQDVDFLNALINDTGETAQFKKLARSRLTAIAGEKEATPN